MAGYMNDAEQGAGLGMLGGPMGAGIGAGVGLLKGLLIDGPQEARQKKASAQEALAAPWTGMKPQTVNYADPFGTTMQGGMTGLGMAQNAQNAQGNQNFQNAQMDYLKQQGGYYDQLRQNAMPAAPGAPAYDPTAEYVNGLVTNSPWSSMGRSN